MRWLLVMLLLAVPAFAQSRSLHSHRLAGNSYVTLDEIIDTYNVPRSQVSVEADQREVALNGVQHWLSFPVLAARGRLWITSLDVLKTLDPVLRQGRSTTRTPIRTIVLDPGHGGGDTGTRGQRGVEKKLTLDVARRVEDALEAAGLNVVLTRTTDRKVELDDRVEFARAKRANLFVSIHFNSGGSADGIETYCTPPAGAGSTATPRERGDASANNRFDERNVWLAHCVQRATTRATGASDRGVRRARFVVIRDAPCPAILIEGGFLSNRAEEQRILREDYRDKLAKSIAAGILEYKRCSETGQMQENNSPAR